MNTSFKVSEINISVRERSKKLLPDIQQVTLRKLRMTNNARGVGDLWVSPANRLEKMSGDRCGHHGIRINDQSRICFIGKVSGAPDVEIADYHRG